MELGQWYARHETRGNLGGHDNGLETKLSVWQPCVMEMDHMTTSFYRRLDAALVVFTVAVLFLTGSIAFTFGWH
jgi:hypothetical protein